MYCEIPANEQVLPDVQHQNPWNAAFTQPQTGSSDAGHCLQAGAWTTGKYVKKNTAVCIRVQCFFKSKVTRCFTRIKCCSTVLD